SFESFSRKELHPFVASMTRALREALDRLRRFPIQTKLYLHKQHRFQSDLRLMRETVDEVIRKRKLDPAASTKRDLLALMLEGTDKVSGEKLDDVNIRFQIITFLIAGHETTSGLLAFAFYYLLKHPETLKRAREEADRVLG